MNLLQEEEKQGNSKIYNNIYGQSLVNKLFALFDLYEGATEDGVLEKLLDLDYRDVTTPNPTNSDQHRPHRNMNEWTLDYVWLTNSY